MSATETTDFNRVVLGYATTNWRQNMATHKQMENGGRAARNAAKQAFRHPDWRVRRSCVGFMDHHADQSCTRGLIQALKDSNACVRRNAIHSLSCDRCKPEPLTLDVIPYVIDVALHDRSMRVRRTAVMLLGGKKPDARVVAAMQRIIQENPDRRVVTQARWVLKQHAG